VALEAFRPEDFEAGMLGLLGIRRRDQQQHGAAGRRAKSHAKLGHVTSLLFLFCSPVRRANRFERF
jgi:hypothetical protein